MEIIGFGSPPDNFGGIPRADKEGRWMLITESGSTYVVDFTEKTLCRTVGQEANKIENDGETLPFLVAFLTEGLPGIFIHAIEEPKEVLGGPLDGAMEAGVNYRNTTPIVSMMQLV
jgi:hypothetical protein